LKGSSERPRLTVNRTLKHFYSQIIDDESGRTLASASTVEKDLRQQLKSSGNCDASVALGKVLAERAKAAGVSSVCFDRGSFKYHGRVAAFASAVREAGIQF
jgi:large subunit ribosomal protein L18